MRVGGRCTVVFTRWTFGVEWGILPGCLAICLGPVMIQLWRRRLL